MMALDCIGSNPITATNKYEQAGKLCQKRPTIATIDGRNITKLGSVSLTRTVKKVSSSVLK